MSPIVTQRSITLPGGRSARVVVASRSIDGEAAVAGLGLSAPRGVLVLHGGTAELPDAVAERLAGLLANGVAQLAIEERVTVVTGGTDAGIFALFGRGLDGRATAPCVGVAPAGAVTWPGNERGAAGREAVLLEPHHSHFLLIEGDAWGDETGALLRLTAALAARCPAIVVLAGGGEIARREVEGHTRAGRQMVVIVGSGRLADELAAGHAERPDIGRITLFPIDGPPAALADLLRAALTGKNER